MPYSYDPILVLVSVLVAIAGAYACFDLIIRVQRSTEPKRRNWLALAALAIGGSIWAMHFIAMLAVQIPSVMQYDILITLVSGLVSILMTAVALTIVSSDNISWGRFVAGGSTMGAGITAMHYVGMSGMRGNFSLSYETGWLVTSVLVGIFASTLSLWLVMGLQLRGVFRRLISAIVMGFSIAGVHYSGMYGTKFEPIAQLAEFTQPILSPFSLGLVTALVTFAILGWTLLMLLPNSTEQQSSDPAPRAEVETTVRDRLTVSAGSSSSYALTSTTSDAMKSEPSPQTLSAQFSLDSINSVSNDSTIPTETRAIEQTHDRIPVQRNKKTYFIDVNEVASISADGHYSTVRTRNGESHFCNIGFNNLLKNVQQSEFFRVHRSHAINIDCVVSFQRKRDKALVTLGDDEHEVPVSRSYVATLQDALGLIR